MNYISLCLEGSRTSEFEPSDRKDIMNNCIYCGNSNTSYYSGDYNAYLCDGCATE